MTGSRELALSPCLIHGTEQDDDHTSGHHPCRQCGAPQSATTHLPGPAQSAAWAPRARRSGGTPHSAARSPLGWTLTLHVHAMKDRLSHPEAMHSSSPEAGMDVGQCPAHSGPGGSRQLQPKINLCPEVTLWACQVAVPCWEPNKRPCCPPTQCSVPARLIHTVRQPSFCRNDQQEAHLSNGEGPHLQRQLSQPCKRPVTCMAEAQRLVCGGSLLS